MNIKDIHQYKNGVSANSFYKGEGTAVAIQILKGEQLKEHITKIPACLLCICGEVVFANELGIKETLKPGDYILIDPFVKHHVNGVDDSQLLLLK